MRAAAAFLDALLAAVPYRIHTVLTDNGIQFADLPKNRVAELFEIGWAVGLKYTEGFTRLRLNVWTILP
jgi:hypothetical protein